MEREFFSLMKQTVTVEPHTGRDSYGKPTYGAAVRRKCHISGKVRMIRTLNGADVLATQTVYMAGPLLDPDDRVTLPTGRVAPIVAIATYYDDHPDLYGQAVYLGAS